MKRGTSLDVLSLARSSEQQNISWIVLSDTLSPILVAMDRHQQAISKGARYRQRCNRCEATSGFTRHELRRRTLRVIVDLTVQIHSIILIRWKCSRCERVFTDLPDFRTSLPTLRQRKPPAFSQKVSGAGRTVIAADRRAPGPHRLRPWGRSTKD